MEAIFGHSMATGRYTLGSSEALGVNQAKSAAAKVEGSAFNHVPEKKTYTEVGEGSNVTPSVLRPKQTTKSCHEHHVYVIMYVMECVDNIFVTSDDQ